MSFKNPKRKIRIPEPVVYGLIDPITNELKYIGYSENHKSRYSNHHNPSKLKKNTHKNNWLKSILAKGLKVEMIILERYETVEKMKQGEIELIEYYKSIGCDLTNGEPHNNLVSSFKSEKGEKRPPWNKGIPMQEHVKTALKKANINKDPWDKGIHWMSEELKEQKRQIMTGNTYCKGIIRTEEQKEKNF